MKYVKKFFSVMLICTLVLSLFGWSVSAESFFGNSAKSDEIPYQSYTYWENYGSREKTPVPCKPMYKVDRFLSGKEFGKEAFSTVSDVFSDGESIYILDDEAGTVTILNADYTLKSRIDGIFLDGQRLDIRGAKGIFAKNGKIYIADTQNARVLVANGTGTVENALPTPTSKLIPDDFNYKPTKITIDSKDYTYIVSDGSYYGALVYSPEMEFMGFYGANTVRATAMDIIQNLIDKLFSNDTKKGSTVLALPYQFNDLASGPEDFIYTVTGNTGSATQTGQVCRMNPGGKNVLNKESFNFLDTEVGTFKKLKQLQNASAIDVDSDGFFYILDSTYGRVFLYDKECSLLCVFGGSLGSVNQKGAFQFADSIALCGDDVLVGDSQRGILTVFSLTDYGRLVRDAQIKTLNDDFDLAEQDWNAVLAQDQNSQLAYKGLAAAYYSAQDDDEAIRYAKLGADRDIYAAAFAKIRQNFLEKNFTLIFVVVILVVALLIFWVVRRRKNPKRIRNERLHMVFYIVPHPFDGARLVKEKQLGSVIIATVILALYYILSAVGDVASGFAFNYFDASDYNSFYILLRTVGLVALWTVSNWLVCVLLGGIGKMKEIYIITCYALIPLVFSSFVSLILSHILTPDEFGFVMILKTACLLYTFFMLMAGISKVHDYEFGKFFGTTLLTVVAMLIVVFLIFLIFLLAQQVYGWFRAVYIEAVYR